MPIWSHQGCHCDTCQIRRAEDARELTGTRTGRFSNHPNETGALPEDELPDPDPSNGAEADVMHPFIADDGDK